MSEPMYGCEYGDCAEECCYPASMLRVYEGKVWCEGCWDNAPTIWPDGQGGDTGCDWVHHWDLEPFVPEHEKRIAALEKQVLEAPLGWDARIRELEEQTEQDDGEILRLMAIIAALEVEIAKWKAWYDAHCSMVDLPAPPKEQGE